MPNWRYVLAVSIGLLLLYLMWPARISPAYWDEPEPPELQENNRLAATEIIAAGEIRHAEDLVTDEDGSVFMGSLFGTLQRVYQAPDGNWQTEELMSVSDRALLGIDWVSSDTLAIAGMDGLHIANLRTGEARSVSMGSPTRPFGFVNDVAVAPDGLVYFTDSTTGWRILDYGSTPFRSFELLENRPHGFVYAYDPATGATRVVLERLHYPNGIALSSDETALLIVETTRFSVRRYQLTGPDAGTSYVIAENLPGVPDGIRADGRGRIFVTMVGPRRPFQRFLNRNPWAVWILYKFGYRPPLSPWNSDAFVLVLDEATGDVIDSFQGGNEGLTSIANAVPTEDGYLWLASDGEPFIARLELPWSYRDAHQSDAIIQAQDAPPDQQD